MRLSGCGYSVPLTLDKLALLWDLCSTDATTTIATPILGRKPDDTD